MTRSEFVRTSAQLLGAAATAATLGPRAAGATAPADSAPASTPAPPPPPPPADPALAKQLAAEKSENEFVNHWLTDLFDTMDRTLDEPARVKLLEGCGRACFERHEFKRAIARDGQGDLDKLLAAYRRNFEIWRDGDTVHIRYGETSPGCYCPAAKHRPARPHDLHCECTRMTHQTIFETALGRSFQVDVLESVRRGGRTCHFLVHLASATAQA